MNIPARFAPLLFGAVLSVIMVAIVSAFVLATTRDSAPSSPRNGPAAARPPGRLRFRR